MRRPDARFEIAPYDYAAAERLSRELGVSPVLAQVLVRRGMGDAAAARSFLEAEAAHPLEAFGGLREAAAVILGHVGRRSRITVHGDYDVDGITSTAILVRALRTLGADVDWYLPSRIDDGYGLAAATVERLAARGTQLLVTVDCAITAVEEVAAARAAGMEVVVTDHHAPRADGALPEAPIVHPRIGGYPCPDLCAAGVAYKLAQALMAGAGEAPEAVDEDLDLVALATVADVVSLTGENRRLVRAGPAAPGGHAQARAAGADGRRARRPQRRRRERDRLPPRAAAQRGRAALPRRRRPRAPADPRPRSAPARSRWSSTRSTPSAATSRPASASRPRRCWPSRARPARPRTCSPPRAGTRA